jgi:hypothetical protein
VIARDADARLWVLEADPYRRSPGVVAAEVTAMGSRGRVASSGPNQVEARFETLLMVNRTVELRAARLVAELGLAIPGERLRLYLDKRVLMVDDAGRLAVPRRLNASPNGRRVTALRPLRTVGPIELGTPLTLLTFYSPALGGEADADYVGSCLEPEPAERPENIAA